MRSAFASGLVALALAGPAFAGPIVDGNVADWAITVGDGNTSNFLTPNVAGTVLGSTFFFAREDQNDLAGDSGFVGPNYGGQNYDVEFMGVALVGSQLFISIVSGQRPDNGLARFSPGDIRIVASNGRVYGIEVGGGAGAAAGAGTLAEAGNPLGSTYILNSSGFTVAHSSSARTVGSIWQDPNWLMDPLPPATAVQLANDGSGTQVGTADFVYTRDGDPTTQHSVIELSLDRAIFGDASKLDIYWAPSCGNDVLVVNDDLPARVPEPGTLAALGIGLLGFFMVRRRR